MTELSELFLGAEGDDSDVWIPLERHALTIAGSRMGKGTAQVIPTLKGWQASAIVIDPKGEAVKATYDDRLAKRAEIAILDPMDLLPDDEFGDDKRSFNPLSLVRDGAAGFRDLMMISDGLVLTTGQEKDPHWNESALSIIAGCLAFMLEDPETPEPHLGLLPEMLRYLRLPSTRGDDKLPPSIRDDLTDAMMAMTGYGQLASETAALIARDTDEVVSLFSTTLRHIRFLRDNQITAVMGPASGRPPLDLAKLRDGSLTLYLVMDPGSLVLHSRFMRLFVRMALSVMMRTTFTDGKSENSHCLFVLDEFFSLGRIEDIQKAAGLMPGYNVHLWPILQDWGQLVDLYGQQGAQTFLANADVVSVFGVSDQTTLHEISSWIGEFTVEEFEYELMQLAARMQNDEHWQRFYDQMKQQGMYVSEQHMLAMQAELLKARLGRSKLLPSEIKADLSKRYGDAHKVADRLYAFLRTGRILELRPRPYFEGSR